MAKKGREKWASGTRREDKRMKKTCDWSLGQGPVHPPTGGRTAWSRADVAGAQRAAETRESSAEVRTDEALTVSFSLRSSFFLIGISSNDSSAVGRD